MGNVHPPPPPDEPGDLPSPWRLWGTRVVMIAFGTLLALAVLLCLLLRYQERRYYSRATADGFGTEEDYASFLSDLPQSPRDGGSRVTRDSRVGDL